jgi:ATP-grasp domain, R2K clade family 3
VGHAAADAADPAPGSWIPGGWCHVDNLDCTTYYAYYGPWLLNSYYTILPGVEALRLQEQLFAEFGVDDEIFVRPTRVHKLFTGRVVYRDDFRDAIAPSRYDPTTMIVISTPKEIGFEWRLVIADDRIVASSQYRDSGAISLSTGCPENVSQYASGILTQVRWRPDRVFVMDVCESDGRLYLLELNSFSCSGLYECDREAVIRAASAVAAAEWMSEHGG